MLYNVRFIYLSIIFLILSVNINSQNYRLTILHSNDAKSKLIKPTLSSQQEFGSAARFKTLYDSLKARGSRKGYNVITLSPGNNILASSEFYISQQLPGDQSYYDSRVMDKINYDAMGFGNHEFDFGPDVTARFIHGFQSGQTTFISSNINFSQEDSLNDLFLAGRIKRYKIITAGGEKIGIIGLLSPELKTLSSPRNITVDTAVATIINGLVDTLNNLGVNKIILLCNYQGIKQDSVIIKQTRGIDVVVSADDYEFLANPDNILVPGDSVSVYWNYPLVLTNSLNELVYLVKTGPDFKYIGNLELEFNSSGVITNVSAESGPVRVAGGSYPDAVMKNQEIETNIITPLQNGLNALASNIIGTTEVELDGIMGNIRTGETNLGNLMADAILWQGKQLASSFGVPVPEIAMHNAGGIRNNNVLPVGNLSELTTFSIAPFGNFTSIVGNIPPQQLKEILENSVSRVQTVEGRFAQISGLRMIYNPNGQAQVLDNSGNAIVPGKRILEVSLNNGTYIVQNGVVNTSAPAVSIAIINFLAKGGDQYPFRGAAFTILGVTDQQSLAKYISLGLSGSVTAAMYPVGGEGRIIADPSANYEEENIVVNEFKLMQNYPNPFNPSTVISYQIPVKSFVTLKVFDILGNEVATLVNEEQQPGSYYSQFKIHLSRLGRDNSQLSSGVYFYTLRAGDFTATEKMILLK